MNNSHKMFAAGTTLSAIRRISHKAQEDVNLGPKEGSCGIPPWKPEVPPPPPPPITELPSHLIRPPCMPNAKQGQVQTCLRGIKGLYCPPCRIKYKYPPFSENIDFTPPIDKSCWWKKSLSCPNGSLTEEDLKGLTAGWSCNHQSDFI